MPSLIEYLLLLVLIFTPVAFAARDLLTISLMEILIFTAAFLWLARSISKGKIALINTALNIPILLFAIIMALQYLAGTMTSARWGTIYPYSTKVYSLGLLSYMIVFLVMVNNISSRRRLNRFIAAIISTGALLAVFGIIQRLAGAGRIFWFREPRETMLFYSSYFNCNYFANYINMVIFLTLGSFLAYLAHLNRVKGFYRFDLFEGWNILFVFALIMMIVSLFHTFSQGAIIAFLLTSALSFFLYFRNRAVPKAILGALFILTAVIAAATLVWIKRSMASDIVSEFSRILREINTYGQRIPVLIGAVKLAGDSPIFGAGLGTFRYIFPMYRPNVSIFIPYAHNDYLDLLVETGLVGLLVFASGMCIFFKRYIKLLNM